MSRLIATVLVVLVASLGVSTESSAKPNVIFILCDDLGWGDLGVLYQNSSKHGRRLHTPMIDRMAAEGMQLRSHYCPAPVCAPSRSSLLTGVHQGHAVVRDSQFDKMLEENHTLGSVMQEAGYKTALIGKYGLQGHGDSAGTWPGYPTKRGFDEFFGYVRHVDGHVHYPADHWPLGDNETHRTPKELWHNDREVSKDLSKCYTTDLFTARSKHWIAEQTRSNPDQPFFLYLAFDTPHAALQVPTMKYPDGQGIDGGIQWTGEPGHMINTAKGNIDSYRHPDYTNKGWSDAEERFATMVRRIDNCVGDLLQTLRDLEIDDSTMVVISSDNGPHHESYLKGIQYAPTSFQSYGPFEGTKRDVWEGGIRVATLAWWPGKIPANSVSDEASQFHDWMATFCDVGGLPAPARSDGVSLTPRLTKLGQGTPSQIYVEYLHHGKTMSYDDFSKAKRGKRRKQMQVLHLDGFKGVRVDIKSHDDPFEIYDLANDPKERHNLAGTSERFRLLQQRMHDQVLRIRRPNASAPRPYDDPAVPAIETENTVAGLTWKFYPGPFPYVPQTSELNATKTGLSAATTGDGLSVDQVQAEQGAVQWTGFLEVPNTGKYRFALSTFTKAFLRIHQSALIDADFGYASGEKVSADVVLEKGFHPIHLTCLCDGKKSPTVELRWRTDSQSEQPIPAQQFSTKP